MGGYFYSRFYKVYLPYSIFLTIAIPLFAYFTDEPINKRIIISYYSCLKALSGDNISGLGHLWFITTIFLCYLLLPIVQIVGRSKKASFIFFVYSLLQFLIFQISLWQFSGIFLFAAGYIYAQQSESIKTAFLVVVFSIALLILCRITWNDLLYNFYTNTVFHVVMGLLFFFSWERLISYIKLPANRLCKWSDKTSFHIYLTHHILIVGPLSMLFMFENLFIGVSFAFMYSAVSGWLLRLLSDKIVKVILH